MKSFSYHPKVKRLKSLNLTPIKSMFFVFADAWQSHVHKKSSKRNFIKENYHSNKFLDYLLVGFTKYFKVDKFWV